MNFKQMFIIYSNFQIFSLGSAYFAASDTSSGGAYLPFEPYLALFTYNA